MSTIRTALLLLLATLFAGPAFAQTPPATPQYNLILSGINGTTIYVDDGFFLSVNGTEIYSDGTNPAGYRNPIAFTAAPGSTLTFHVDDTYGYHAGLGALYLRCAGSSTYTFVNAGFDMYTALGNNHTVFRGTYTIPSSLPGCTGASIASVEMTQAIQQYQLLADLKASLAANGEPPVPLIAGKPGVVRVYFGSVTDVTPATLTVAGAVTGSQSVTLQPNCSPTDQRAGNHGCQSADFYFTPFTGPSTITLTLTDNQGNQLQQENLTFTPRVTNAVQLYGVQGCIYVGGTPKQCASPSILSSLLSTSTALLPTFSVSASSTWSTVTRMYLDPDFYKDMAKDADALYTASDQASDIANGTRSDYIAVWPEVGTDGTGWSAGEPSHGAMVPNHATAFGVDETAETVTHEVGHTLNIAHTGSGIPSTTTYPGCYLTAPVLPGTTPYWSIYPDNRIQDLAGLEDGFDVANQRIIDPSNTFDLMSYCTPRWISPIQYGRLITSLGGGIVNIAGGSIPATLAVDGPATPVTPAPVQPRTPPTAGSFWLVAGKLLNGSVKFDPVFLESVTASTDPGAGTYTLQVLDKSANPLYSRLFTPQTTAGESDPNSLTPVEDTFFSQWIPYYSSAASFAVLDATGTTIATLPITGVVPTVAFTSPSGAFSGTGVQTISWAITDPDSTSFTSRVFYSFNNGASWYQVSFTTQPGLTLGTDTVDFTALPGSPTALLRVYVSDGVNTGVATTAPFAAPRKLPSTIVINTPISGATQAAANPVLLTGSAYDADDGFLTGKALVWSSDVQGALGTGSPLSVSLKPGSHTLTLTATDSDGNALTATTKITLGGAGPTLSLTTAASGACTTATVTAAPGAQGAPLSLAQYSLDGGLTYTNIPLTALPFSLPLITTGALEIVARAYDTSKQFAAQSARVTLATACVTQTLNALSGSGQTTVVGTAFPAPLVAQVVDSNGKGIPGVSVTFTGPTGGAAATFTTPVVTASDGTASIMPIADTTLGSYTITAAASGIASTAAFTVANTDYSVAAGTPILYILHGGSQTETITLTALGGFNSTTALSCTGLPAGVTCSFAPATLTPTGGTAASTLTVNAANAQSARLGPLAHPGWSAGLVTLCGVFGFFSLGRRRRLTFVLTLLLTAVLLGGSGCGGFQGYSSNVTVNAKTATATRTATIQVFIQ